MTRREAIRAVLGCVALAPFVASAGKPSDYPTDYGYVDVENCYRVTGRSPADARVYLDGKAVTPNAHRLNDREGWVEVFDELPNGGKYLNALGQVARRIDYGRVQLRFIAKGAA